MRVGNHELEFERQPKRTVRQATIDTLLGAAEVAAGMGLGIAYLRNYAQIETQPEYQSLVAIAAAAPFGLVADGIRRVTNTHLTYRRHGEYFREYRFGAAPLPSR